MKLILVALAATALSTPGPTTESATWGSVRATFTYSATDDGQYKDLRLTVDRGGTVALDYVPKPICPGCTVSPGSRSGGRSRSSSVNVADLDRNGEPVVVLDLYTGGAHCCLYSVFFRFDGAGYVSSRHSWGNEAYRFVDLGHDGVPEFVTRDDRFNYAFSCYACSGAPVRILRVVNRRLVDVTRAFPVAVRHDAALWWRTYRLAVRRHEDVSGVLPAYVADEALVGRAHAAFTRLRHAVARPSWRRDLVDPRWRNRLRYIEAVRAFLRETGYLR